MIGVGVGIGSSKDVRAAVGEMACCGGGQRRWQINRCRTGSGSGTRRRAGHRAVASISISVRAAAATHLASVQIRRKRRSASSRKKENIIIEAKQNPVSDRRPNGGRKAGIWARRGSEHDGVVSPFGILSGRLTATHCSAAYARRAYLMPLSSLSAFPARHGGASVIANNAHVGSMATSADGMVTNTHGQRWRLWQQSC